MTQSVLNTATLGTKPQHVSLEGQGHAQSKLSQSLNALCFDYGGPMRQVEIHDI